MISLRSNHSLHIRNGGYPNYSRVILDGCPSEEASLIPGGAIIYSWAESEIGTTLTQPCPCRDLVDIPGGTGTVIRHCGGTYTHGAQWREVDFSRCGLSVTAIQLCEATLVCSQYAIL